MDELDVELAALEWWQSLGYSLRTGADVDAVGERADSSRPLLEGRLSAAIHRLNDQLPHDVAEQIVRTLGRPPHPTLIQNNRWFDDLLTNGAPVEYKDAATGEMRGGLARLIEFDNPARQRLSRRAATDDSRAERENDPAGPDPVRQRAAACRDRTDRPGERRSRSEHGDRPVRALQRDHAGFVRAEPVAGGERRIADAGGEHHQRAATLHAVATGNRRRADAGGADRR